MSNNHPRSLRDYDVLVLDIQATGANPESNHILEMGWAAIGPGAENSSPTILSSVVKIAEDVEISRHVLSITGLSENDFLNGRRLSEVWSTLMQSAGKILKRNGSGLCPLVIHYARFEEPYLRRLHRRFNGNESFPFRIICTHEISKRLFPELPRKGLRAVAGYLGYSTDQLRRSAHHAAATAFIWQSLIPVIENTADISSMEDLLHWLAYGEKGKSAIKAYPMKDTLRMNVPDHPGIYMMRRVNGDILYIGKAASLRKRVRSHFQKKSGHSEHVLEMLSQAQDLDYRVTKSAVEAAVLESDAIKELSPPYNILLKKGNREVYFFSGDLDSCNVGPTKKYCVGPIPSNDLFAGLHNMISLVKSGKGESSMAELSPIPGLPDKYQPDCETFAEGVKIFRDKYETSLRGRVTLSGLLQIGTHVWKENLEDRDKDQDAVLSDEGSDKTNEGVDAEFVWTPEGVTRSIESVLSRSSLLIRRSRWFCLLSESSFSWKNRKQSPPEKMVMVIHKGGIKAHSSVGINLETPVPPGYRKKFSDRQRNIDLAAYDRMRVLTTEMRRLIKEDRFLQLRLSPGGVIRKDRLSRFLRWV